MKFLRHLKNAIRYEWFDVLFDRFYGYEHCGELPLNDIHQDIAKRITFAWGFSIGFGIGVLLWIFTIFPLIGTGVVWMIASLAGVLLFSLLCGVLIAVGYLTITLIRLERRAREAAESERLENGGKP